MLAALGSEVVSLVLYRYAFDLPWHPHPWLLVLQMTPVIVLTPIIVLWAGPGTPGIITDRGEYLAGYLPGERLRTLLWDRAGAAVLTSATLQACGSFDLFMEEAGLKAWEGVHALSLPSPFDHAAQAELHLPRMKGHRLLRQRSNHSAFRWQDKAANQKFFAGELQAFMKDAAAILLEAGVIRKMPDNFDAMLDTSFIK